MDREHKAHPSRIWTTFKALIRTRLTAGLITILPILVTIWLVLVVFRWFRDASKWVVLGVLENSWFQHSVFRVAGMPGAHLDIDKVMQDYPAIDWGISLASILLTIALLYIVGLFAANVIGRRILALLETLVDRVPLVATIYRTLKQILALFGGDQTQGFKRVALVPFPNEITRSVAFITNTMRDAVTGEELCACFIATTPNPTTGFVFVLKRADIIEVDWSVEDAIKVVMSGGILSPEYVTMVTTANAANAGAAAQVRPGPCPPAALT